MISGIKTAVILVLIIDFIQLLGGGKEYGHFIKLVTGLLVACSLCGGVLQLMGSITEDTWLLWLTGEGNELETVWDETVEGSGLESVWDEAVEGSGLESVWEETPESTENMEVFMNGAGQEGGAEKNDDAEESTGNSVKKAVIEVPAVENIPIIEVEKVRIEE